MCLPKLDKQYEQLIFYLYKLIHILQALIYY